MASTVQIQVRVDDGNSVETLSRIETALGQVGVSGTASIKKAGEAVDQLGGHAASNLDKVRLLSQEFGLRMPRALESMISRIPGVTNALAGMTGALAGVAFAEIFTRGAEAIYNAEQKYISITAAADKFYESLKKTSELDFTNTKDLATTQARLDQATTRMSTGPKLASGLQGGAFSQFMQGNLAGGIGMMAGAHAVADDGAKGAAQMIELTKTQLDQQHQQTIASINLAHAKDSLLQVDQRANAEAAKKIALAREDRTYDTKVQKNYGNIVPGDAGAAEEKAKNDAALADASVANTKASQAQMLDITKAQNSAREAGLQGEAQYQQKYKDELATLQLELGSEGKLGELVSRRAAITAQFDADRLARVRELTEQTARAEQEASAGGLQGAARIIAERDAAIQRINAAQAKFSGGAAISPEASNDFDRQRAAAANESYAKLNELAQTYTTRANDLAQERADAELGAYGKIDAAAARQIDSLKKSYEQDSAALADSDQQKIEMTQAYNNAVVAINQNAEAQKAEISARNRSEDANFDREAQEAESKVRQAGATNLIASHQAAIAAIEDQEQQRLLKLQEDAAKEGLTWQEVAQRRADIERTAAADIAEQNQQLAHTIAGDLQSAFTNPMGFIKQQGEKMMFEMIARWVMQLSLFKNTFGSMMGSLQPGSPSGTVGVSGAAKTGLGAIFNGGRPSGTGGVISGGTMLPNGYSSTGLSGDTGGGYSSTTASPDSPAYGPTSSTITSGGSRSSGGGAASDIASAVGGARSLTSLFGLKPTQASSTTAGMPGLSGTTDQWNDPTDPEAQASAASNPALQTTSTTSGAASQALGIAGAGFAAYQGGKGVYDSFSQGGAKGALDGAMSGAAAGAALGSVVPGLGTVIGGVAGAAAGLAVNLVGDAMGESGRLAAREYYRNTLFPEMEQMRETNDGSDYLSKVSELNRDAASGMQYMTQKYGIGAANWVNANYLKKEVADVAVAIERRAGSGGQYIGATAKQFHGGGTIDGFGSLSTSTNEGYIHAMVGEGVVNQPAMATHGAGVGMMNNGATPADMAAHYLAMSGGGGTRSSAPSSGGDNHFHINAMDMKSFEHSLNNGGAKVISRAMNKLTGSYAGDGQL